MNDTLKTRLKVYNKSVKRNKKINFYESIKNLDEHTFGIPKRVLIPKKDGGEREVFVYNSSDSLLLKMLSEKICENRNKDLYKHLYSYKEGIGCVDAVKYVMESAKGMYGYKLDITNYFMSVPMSIIEKNLKLIFQDDKELGNILKFYKDNRYYDVDDSLKHRFLSLKPGNPLSAFLSNFVLNDLDKLMDSISDVYVRYSDDILIFCKDINKLNNIKSVLIDELNKIEGFHWIRLLYQYPDAISDEILDAMKRNEKVLPYFDIPIQHANNRLLKLMNRKGTKEDILRVVNKIRDVFPKAILRTTIIVGFPSETEEEFQELLDFVDEIKFDRLGAFTYSPEEDTVAYSMPDTIEKEVKEDRYHRLMRLQSHISYERMQTWLGEVIEVCVESRDPKSLIYHGRSLHSAPDDVDGEVLFTSNKLLKKGSFVQVKVNRVEEYDLFGETVE